MPRPKNHHAPIRFYTSKPQVGYVQIDAYIVDEVYRLVDVHRKQIGLVPMFESQVYNSSQDDKVIKVEAPEAWPPPPEPTYSQAEINEALSKGGSIRVRLIAGDKKIKCHCNCGGYLPASTAMQGWKYLHKHKTPDALNKNGQLRNGSSHAKPVTKTEVYVSYIDRIKMDIANVESDMKGITQQAQLLGVKLSGLKARLQNLKAAETALSSLTIGDQNV